MGKSSDIVDQAGDRWLMKWLCHGTMQIREDAAIEFSGLLVVDQFGDVSLEGGRCAPDGGTSYTYEGTVPIEWQWEAVFGQFGVPTVSMAFTRMTGWGT